MQHGYRHEDLVAQLDAERAAGKDNETMRHQNGKCWCGHRHTTSERFFLNVTDETAPAEPSDEVTEIAREYEAQENE
jgi:hypothetical protein